MTLWTPEEHPRLEALLHERDHIRIRISIQLDRASPDRPQIDDLYRQLDDIERRISASEGNPPAA